MTTPSFPATPGQEILVEPIADSDVEITSTSLTIDGQTVALDDLGRGTFIADMPGRYEVSSTVVDVEGRETTVTDAIFVRDPSDRSAPVISITELTPPIITELRQIIVDIFDDGLAEYRIELIPSGGGTPFLLGAGTTSICDHIDLDPGQFQNGFYTIRVTASDFGGLETVVEESLEINSADKTAAVIESSTDLSVTLAGIDLRCHSLLQLDSDGRRRFFLRCRMVRSDDQSSDCFGRRE